MDPFFDLLDEYDDKNTKQEESITEGSFSKVELQLNTEANIGEMVSDYKAFLTGSRAWLMHKEDSDWDYIMGPFRYNDLLKAFDKKHVTYMNHPIYKAIYVKDEFGEFNIICVSDFDLDAWKFATKTIKGMIDQGAVNKKLFEDKDKVYGMFENLKTLYRFIRNKEEF